MNDIEKRLEEFHIFVIFFAITGIRINLPYPELGKVL